MEKLTDVIIEKEISKMEDKEVIVYGLSTGIELVFNIVTTVVLGVVFGMVLESIVFLISFSFIRIYAGGYHCEKAINCYLMSSGIVTIVLLLVKYTPSTYMLAIGMVLLLVSLPIILKLAPVESSNKPLDKVELECFRKKTISHLCMETVLILGLFILSLYNFAFVICLGLGILGGLILLQRICNKNFLCM